MAGNATTQYAGNAGVQDIRAAIVRLLIEGSARGRTSLCQPCASDVVSKLVRARDGGIMPEPRGVALKGMAEGIWHGLGASLVVNWVTLGAPKHQHSCLDLRVIIVGTKAIRGRNAESQGHMRFELSEQTNGIFEILMIGLVSMKGVLIERIGNGDCNFRTILEVTMMTRGLENSMLDVIDSNLDTRKEMPVAG